MLFVDYIAEHLLPTGRAGIIVPEGIIFQSGGAYKQLREMLVKNYLVSVISLPAGVFNPYSGVKTSILILGKRFAQQTDKVLFVKIENDGFNLGAQRRPIGKNDLEEAKRNFWAFMKDPYVFKNTAFAHAVHREQIVGNGDWNLSGDRYVVTENRSSTYGMEKLGDICDLIGGSTPSKSEPAFWTDGKVKWISSKHIDDRGKVNGYELITERAIAESSTKVAPAGAVILITRVSVGKFAWADDDYAINQDLTGLVVRDQSKLDPKYLFAVTHHLAAEVERNAQGIGVRGVTRSFLADLTIPVPPLPVQCEIVAEIESYQKIIDGARQVVENYQPRIAVLADWFVSIFADAPFQIIDGDRGTNYPSKEEFSSSGYCLFLSTKNVRSNGFAFDEMSFITKEKDAALRKGKLQRGDVLLTTRGTIGNTAIFDSSVPYEHIRINSGMLIFRVEAEKIAAKYLFYYLQSENFKQQINRIVSGAAQPQLPIRDLNQILIPLPDLQTQKIIVTEIEAEQQLINANNMLISRFESKTRALIDRVWSGA